MSIAQPSVMSLLLEMRFNGQALATGTGFLVTTPNGPVLITNRHNVTGRNQENNQPLSPTGGVPNEIVIVQNRLNHLGSWVLKIEQLYDGTEPKWKEHPTLGARADFVALPLNELTDVHVYAYDLLQPGPDIHLGPAEAISVVGFPFGMTAGGAFPVWATGFVASEPDVNFNNLPVFLIDCRSRPGQSGSVVIYSGRINQQSDIGIVWKASALLELVNSL